ncbi:MAG: alanine racemase [Planctomycetota bacterium]
MLRIPIETGIAAGAPAWIEVDLEAVAHNVREFVRVRVLGPGCRVIAVVKANAYGHGMARVARAALVAGASGLAVANVAEGEELRGFGIEAPILVIGAMAPEEASAAILHELVPSLGSRELAHAVHSAARRPVPVHIEIDTGMRRHGVPVEEVTDFVAALQVQRRLHLAGVFTHFAAVHERELAGMQQQLVAFSAALARLRDLGTPLRHAANTLGALLVPEARLDAVRIGGGLYGFDPLRGQGPVQLRPALSLKARLVGLRDAAVSDEVGYGGTFVCCRPSRLGLVPLGYADGLVRSAWHDASVLVRGRRAPIVGVASMNQTVVDVTEVPDVTLGDEVVLLGAQGDEVVRVEERVPPGGTCYEVTSLLRANLPRRYLPARGGGAVGHGHVDRGLR